MPRESSSTEWWQRTHRIADFTVPVWTETTAREAVRARKDLAFDVDQVAPLEARGGQRGVFHFRTRASEEVPQDYLGPYLEEARAAGIRVIATLNVHWLESGFAAHHRDWLQLRADGALIDDVRGRGAAACPNSPGFRSWTQQVIRDLARYPVDGILLEGPAFLPHACWCAACAATFQEKQGKSLPPRENWEDAAWKEFIEFRYDSVTEFVQQARAALKKTRTGAVFSSRGPEVEAGWIGGRDTRRLAAHQDLVCSDPAPQAWFESLWCVSLRTRLLETRAAGKPGLVPIPGIGRWIHTTPTGAQTRLAYAEVMAHGAWPVYHAQPSAVETEGAKAAAEMNVFARQQSRYLEGATSIADVAVLWSDRTADFYHATIGVTEHSTTGERHTRRQRSGDHLRAVVGWLDCLTRMHLQFDVVDERTLDDGLDRYRVLVLPNVACVSQKHAALITAWVHAGGTLISTFETAHYTDWGVRRSTPALHEVLGIEPSAVDGPTDCDYFDRAEDPVFHGVDSPLVPSPRYRSLVTLSGSGGARAVSWYRERLVTPYHPLPPISRHPAIVDSRWGDGSSLYFAGTIDETYLDHHHPHHAALMTTRIRSASRQPVRLETAGSVQVAVRYQRSKRRLLVHLINATGEMTRPITRVAPVSRGVLVLEGLKSLAGAYWVTPASATPRKIATKKGRKGGWEITLPRLDVYGIAVLEGVTLKT